MPAINYNSGIQRAPAWAEAQLMRYMSAAGAAAILVTSTLRSPEDQARIMYDNAARDLGASRRLYGAGGNKVLDVFETGRNISLPADMIRSQMAMAIRNIGPANVSKHIDTGSGRFVVDIAPSSLAAAQYQALLAILQQARTHGEVGELIWPPKDPAIHVELVPGGSEQWLQAAANAVSSGDVEGGGAAPAGGTGMLLAALAAAVGAFLWWRRK